MTITGKDAVLGADKTVCDTTHDKTVGRLSFGMLAVAVNQGITDFVLNCNLCSQIYIHFSVPLCFVPLLSACPSGIRFYGMLFSLQENHISYLKTSLPVDFSSIELQEILIQRNFLIRLVLVCFVSCIQFHSFNNCIDFS